MPDNTSPFSKEVKITLDRERTLKFPIPAIWKLEDLTGIDISTGIRHAEEFYGGTVRLDEDTKEYVVVTPATLRQRMNRIIDMLWAGLITDDPTVTRDFVASYVSFRNFRSIDELVGEAYRSYWPDAPEKGEGGEEGPLAETASAATH